MWREEDHPRDEQGRFTAKDIHDMSADELKAYILSNDTVSGAISGAIDPDSEEGQEHAERFYEEMRHRKDDISSITKNTGWLKSDIEKINNYVFIEKHELIDGYKHFYSNSDMAESWQRLISNRIREVDILLFRHEMLEMEYVESGMSQKEAHDKTNETYNYGAEIEKIKRSNRQNGLYKKHKEKR